jgi:hypothetical protein
MATVFSSRFQISTNAVLIKRASSSETAGDNLIPADVKPTGIQIVADLVGGSPPVFWAKGLHNISEFGKVETGIYKDDNCNNDYRYVYIKSDSGSIWVNLFVQG